MARMAIVLAALGLLAAAEAGAQITRERDMPAPAVEASAGYSGFIDESLIRHALFGASARYYVTPRLAIGPELVWMVGPGYDRDLFLTGNLTFDLLRPTTPGARLVTPYLVAGGGWFQHRDRFGSETLASNEGAFTAGGGVRVWLSPRTYVAGEVRAGWEPHVRYSGHAGFALGR
jgi:hypothetical protein